MDNLEKKYFVKSVAIFGIIIAIIVGGYYFYSENYKNSAIRDNSSEENDLPFILIKDTKVYVDIVSDEDSRGIGLSERVSLKENEGMFFVFDNLDIWGFWMKEMKFPIDIIWFDENYSVVDIKENALPESYPEIFLPADNSLYVLEVSAGFVKKHEIKIGDFAEIKK